MKKGQKIKSTEKLITKVLKDGSDKDASLAFSRLLDYYSIFDLVYGSTHSAIVKEIYISKNYNVDTVFKVAYRHNISESTFTRYRQEYIRLFIKIYYQINPNGKLFQDID